tara:strand:+ start:414 stop:854 length:441 start_codon:yes stop_codon:yes gene_type:complete
MREMNFSTDKFMRGLREMLDTMKKDFVDDMCSDASIVSKRLIEDFTVDNDKCLKHMSEIGTLANMATNFQHDCEVLIDEFNNRFRYDHGDQKHSATALDAMKIITEIGSDIDNIAPHIGFLFEPDDECIPSIFRDAFVETFEIPAE